MNNQDSFEGFELPKNFERILKKLRLFYEEMGFSDFLEIIDSARWTINTGTDFGSYADGDAYGHTVILYLTPDLFRSFSRRISESQDSLKDHINGFSNFDGEYIAGVQFELEEAGDTVSFSESSEVAVYEQKIVGVSADDILRIWGRDDYLQVFLSHKSEEKRFANDLKIALEPYGISCFVAHADIEPTREWQTEIEKAIWTMEALIAVLTPGFKDSNWTCQELGAAVGLRIPVFPLEMGVNPFGFIGKIQAIKGADKTPREIARTLFNIIRNNVQIGEKSLRAFVIRFARAENFDEANSLFKILNDIWDMPDNLVNIIEEAYTENNQLSGAFTVQNNLPYLLRKWRTEF